MRGKLIEPKSTTEKLVVSQLTDLASIIKDLLADKTKIPVAHAVIVGKSANQILGKQESWYTKSKLQKSKLLMNDPRFDESIIYIKDIPAAWLWSLWKKLSTTALADATVETLASKSDQQLRMITTYFTGRLI